MNCKDLNETKDILHDPDCRLIREQRRIILCQLDELIFNYIQHIDVIRNILIPFVGYNSFYYVVIDMVVAKDQH